MNLRERRRLNNTAEGANFGAHGCPLCEAPVLPLLQQVLLSMEVGKLKKNPGAIYDLCRLNLMVMPVISQITQILRALQHLAAEVGALVHTNPEHTGNLQDEHLCKFKGSSVSCCARKLAESVI